MPHAKLCEQNFTVFIKNGENYPLNGPAQV